MINFILLKITHIIREQEYNNGFMEVFIGLVLFPKVKEEYKLQITTTKGRNLITHERQREKEKSTKILQI